VVSSSPTQTKAVRLAATLRAAARAKEIDVPLTSGATVRDLLQAIEQTTPALAEKLLDANLQLQPGIQVLMNGRNIEWLQGLDTPVTESDDMMLLPPLAGG
jgi:molybdopterin synthase sulfur carrier subunit